MTNPLTEILHPTATRAVVRPVGEVDWGTVAPLRHLLTRALADATAAADDTLLVDLSGITFMDCAGLTVLLQARRDWGGRLELYGLPASLRRILRALGMDGTFTIVDTLADEPDEPDEPGAYRETR